MLFRFSTIACFAALLAGCVHYDPLDTSYSGPKALPAAVAERYDYEAAPPDPEAGKQLEERRNFVVRRINLAPIKPDGAADTLAKTIRLEYYDVDAIGPTPVVLVLPILNGRLRISRYFANYFARHGWAAVVVLRDREAIPIALQHVEQTMRRNVLDYRRILDWMSSNPTFEPNHIGVFGISFGGIDSIVLAAIDDRIDAVVAGMAGGGLADLFVNTTYRGVASQVAAEMRRTGLSRDALEHRLAAKLETGPMRLAPYVNAENVLMIMTRTDWIIPFEMQENLREKLGEPKTIVLPTGHRTSVVYFPLVRRAAYEFMADRFGVAIEDDP